MNVLGYLTTLTRTFNLICALVPSANYNINHYESPPIYGNKINIVIIRSFVY